MWKTVFAWTGYGGAGGGDRRRSSGGNASGGSLAACLPNTPCCTAASSQARDCYWSMALGVLGTPGVGYQELRLRCTEFQIGVDTGIDSQKSPLPELSSP